MKRLIVASFTALALASPVVAQERMTQPQCTDSLSALTSLAGMSPMGADVVLGDVGWCLLADTDLAIDPRTTIRLATLRWRVSDVGRFIEDGLPPRALEVVGAGIGIVPNTGDVVFDYLLGIQMSRSEMGFGMAVRWDGVQNAVVVDSSYIEFDATNRIEATARIDDVNLTDMASIQTSFGTMGLRDLTVKAQFDGWFETYFAMPFGELVLEDDGASPQTQVETLKQQAFDFIAALPDTFMPAQSRTALSEFTKALPTPKGAAHFLQHSPVEPPPLTSSKPDWTA